MQFVVLVVENKTVRGLSGSLSGSSPVANTFSRSSATEFLWYGTIDTEILRIRSKKLCVYYLNTPLYRIFHFLI
jgi:hypothetical protein